VKHEILYTWHARHPHSGDTSHLDTQYPVWAADQLIPMQPEQHHL